jgi:hypothetical protein
VNGVLKAWHTRRSGKGRNGAHAGQSRPGLPLRVDGKVSLSKPSKPAARKIVSTEARKPRMGAAALGQAEVYPGVQRARAGLKPRGGVKRCKNAGNDGKTAVGTGPARADGDVLPGLHWGGIGARGAGSGNNILAGGVMKRALAGFWRVGRAVLGLSAGHLGVLAGGLQSFPRGAEAVGGGQDGAVPGAVQDGQFGLLGLQPTGQSDGVAVPHREVGAADQRGDDRGGRFGARAGALSRLGRAAEKDGGRRGIPKRIQR